MMMMTRDKWVCCDRCQAHDYMDCLDKIRYAMCRGDIEMMMSVWDNKDKDLVLSDNDYAGE